MHYNLQTSRLKGSEACVETRQSANARALKWEFRTLTDRAFLQIFFKIKRSIFVTVNFCYGLHICMAYLTGFGSATPRVPIRRVPHRYRPNLAANPNPNPNPTATCSTTLTLTLTLGMADPGNGEPLPVS